MTILAGTRIDYVAVCYECRHMIGVVIGLNDITPQTLFICNKCDDTLDAELDNDLRRLLAEKDKQR
jgi:hypothetical protein